MKHTLTSSLLCILLTSTVYAKNETSRPVANATVQFMENKGQITDQHCTVRRDIDAKVEANGVVLFVGDGELHYQWTRPVDSRQLTVSNKSGATGPTPTPPAIAGQAHPRGEEDSEVEIYRMDVKLVGANKTAEVIFEEPTGYYENYYLGHTGKEGVTAKGYGRVIYKDIYPNIDLVLYTESKSKVKSQNPKENNPQSNIEYQTSNIKYDFIIHPGGKPAMIQLRYEGATELKLADGSLVASTPFGSITEAAPYSYSKETGVEVASAYKLSGNTLSFDVGSYTGTLVVDPTLHWATYYSGWGNGVANNADKISCDNWGNIYMSSGTTSQTLVATTGAFQTTKASGATAGFLVKFNSNGVRQWGTYYGGLSNTAVYFYANVCDQNGDIYVGGYGAGSGLATNNGHQSVTNFGTGLIVKFNPNGQRMWATYYGYNNSTVVFGLCISPFNELYVTGVSKADSGIATSGTHKQVYTVANTIGSNTGHAFIAKFDATGTRKWGTYYGDTTWTVAETISSDDSGNVFIGGRTFDTRFIASSGTYQPNIGSSNDAFVAKFDSTGMLVWGTYYGGEADELLYGSICDDSGNIYVCGRTKSDTGIATSSSFQNSKSVNVVNAGFLAKFSGSGQRQWATYRTGNNDVFLNGIILDNENNILVAGSTAANDLATIGGHRWKLFGSQDALICKFTRQGEHLWTTYFGGNDGDNVHDILVDGSNYIYVSGRTTSDSGLATSNAHQTTYYGSGVGSHFLAKLDNYVDTVTWMNYISKTTVCSGDTLKIAYKVTPLGFASGNTFTVQLSNSSGSFANPVNIGSINSVSDDTLVCIIPSNTLTGNGYKIRIKSAFPVSYSGDSSIVIYAYPASPIISTDSVLCTEDTLHLSAVNSGAGVTYTWTGPNSFSSTSKDTTIANVSTSASGLYTVTATRAVCSVQDTQTILVKQSPEKPVGSSNSPICEGDTLQLTASTSTNGVIYSWSGPSGFTGNTNDTNITGSTPAMSGNYIVTTDLSGCFKNDTVFVNVKPLPSAVSLSNNGPVCAGDTLQILSGTSTTGTTYTWTGPGGYSAGNEDTSLVNATPAQTGWYKLSLSLNGCARQDSTYAVVTPIPVIQSTSYNNPLCVGENLSLSTGNIAGASYTWWGAGSFSSNMRTPVKNNIQFSDTGWYYVSASVNTCTSEPDSIRVTLNPLPFVAIAASPGNTICSGEPVQFTAYANNHGGTPAYEWYINGIATGNAASIFNTSTLNNGDIVRCDMVEHTKCSAPYTDASNDITMTVNPWLAPAVSITADAGPSLFPNEPVNFTATAMDAGSSPKYQWKRNGIDVQGATGAVWGANANFLSDGDEICVLITSSYACPRPDTMLSNCIKLQIRVGVDDIVNNKNIKIYPNPVRDILHVEALRGLPQARPAEPFGRGELTVELIDVLGRSARRQLLTAQGTPPYASFKGGIVDVSALVPGVYVVRVNGVVAGRVVKE